MADAIVCILLILSLSKIVPLLMVHLHQSLIQRKLLESIHMHLCVHYIY